MRHANSSAASLCVRTTDALSLWTRWERHQRSLQIVFQVRRVLNTLSVHTERVKLHFRNIQGYRRSCYRTSNGMASTHSFHSVCCFTDTDNKWNSPGVTLGETWPVISIHNPAISRPVTSHSTFQVNQVNVWHQPTPALLRHAWLAKLDCIWSYIYTVLWVIKLNAFTEGSLRHLNISVRTLAIKLVPINWPFMFGPPGSSLALNQVD